MGKPVYKFSLNYFKKRVKKLKIKKRKISKFFKSSAEDFKVM